MVPTHAFNRYGYDLEFNAKGRMAGYRIDFPAMAAHLEGKGVEFFGPTVDTGVCHMAFFKDPDGNSLILHHRHAPYADGSPVHVRVDLPDNAVFCKVWRANVGRIPLYLLDTNLQENAPADRDIDNEIDKALSTDFDAPTIGGDIDFDAAGAS